MAVEKLASFDLDFRFGQEGEALVNQLLTEGGTIEVKRDRKWWSTNNLYIEVECWYQRSQSWEPSGLSVTKAAYWAFVLERGVFMVPTGHVRHAIQKYGREITCEIPPNRSKGYLITVENLLDVMKELKDD
ncbi:hypothetical protein uvFWCGRAMDCOMC403_052 [Freshwater phage uvFW-CGR-AMD-COM-C403]|jgi:hypothetical protein|nr:hypothetical protein uvFWCGRAMDCOMC403_052 [Freshwater phage uvFW-CGR-AMD-COM-C403]